MIARSLSETVVFSKPFLLKGVDRILPGGDYAVVNDEELIEEEVTASGLPARFNDDLCAGSAPGKVHRDGVDRPARSSDRARSRHRAVVRRLPRLVLVFLDDLLSFAESWATPLMSSNWLG